MTNPSLEPHPDAIVEGIHRIREQLLAEHGGDLRAYFEAVRRRQEESGRLVVSRPARARQEQATPKGE
jgi:hypothetical protein